MKEHAGTNTKCRRKENSRRQPTGSEKKYEEGGGVFAHERLLFYLTKMSNSKGSTLFGVGEKEKKRTRAIIPRC